MRLLITFFSALGIGIEGSGKADKQEPIKSEVDARTVIISSGIVALFRRDSYVDRYSSCGGVVSLCFLTPTTSDYLQRMTLRIQVHLDPRKYSSAQM